jgi:phosphate transport system protein
MPRDTLDRQINSIKDEVLILGSMVEQSTLKSVDTLKNRDVKGAQDIFEYDLIINEKRFAIENAVLILIATQQPIARDLRLLAAILEVITELERMGDYAKGIGKITIKLEAVDIPIPIRDITKMAELAVEMLHKALGAFVNEDSHQAQQIPLEDDRVDELYTKIYHEVVTMMVKNPSIIDHANLLMWVAHNLERLADRVTNICERTIFISTGELLEMDSTDDEDEQAT